MIDIRSLICSMWVAHMLIYVKCAMRKTHDGKPVLPFCHSLSWGVARLLLSVCLLTLHGPAGACRIGTPAPAAVRAVSPQGDVTLEDGSLVRLSGILWPDASRPAHRLRLRAELDALLIGESLMVERIGAPDRWRRRQAVITRTAPPPGEPSDIQSHLIAGGLAAHWPQREAGGCGEAWQEAERQARENRIGIWAPARRRAGRWRLSRQREGQIAVFEGVIRSVRAGRQVTFINFEGPRAKIPVWMLSQRQLKVFRNAGLDPAAWAGKRLLVRAHVTGASNSRLLVESPAQIEIIDGTAR